MNYKEEVLKIYPKATLVKSNGVEFIYNDGISIFGPFRGEENSIWKYACNKIILDIIKRLSK